MDWIPVPVVIPLLVAAILAGANRFIPRRVADVVACLTAAFSVAVCGWLLRVSLHGPLIYWFGDWTVDARRFPIGICFVVDPAAAAMAVLVCLLVLAALIVTWNYFDSVRSLFHSLMLAFLAAMCGMCLSGDLFNVFVWFELMTAAAVTLCGYKAEETGPLVGALNFAVTNTVGAFLTLTGLALLYAWTGSLNFAGIADGLARHPPPTQLLLISMMFVFCGFLVKAAVVPFHFWLADAHAVAPTPVCVLFSGVMVELGIYALARIYFGVFSHLSPGIGSIVRQLLVPMGTLTAVLGAVECFLQRHIKRLLAFSTISHAGLMLIGLGLLSGESLAGAAIYILGHGLIKGTLFICAGILLHHFGSVDEFDLHSRGKPFPTLGILMAIGAIALAGSPPFGLWQGEALVDRAAEIGGMAWIHWIFIFAGVVTSATVLRVVGRVFLGLGHRRPPPSIAAGREKRETTEPPESTPVTMWLPIVLLLLIAATFANFGQVRRSACATAENIVRTGLYRQAVLNPGRTVNMMTNTPLPPNPSIWKQMAAPLAAILLAALALSRRVGSLIQPTRITSALRRGFHIFQSGRIGDYIAWLVFGFAAWSGWVLAHG